MATEHHKPGRDIGTLQNGPKTFAQALAQMSAEHFNTTYGPHPDWLGVGGADIHHPHVRGEVDHDE